MFGELYNFSFKAFFILLFFQFFFSLGILNKNLKFKYIAKKSRDKYATPEIKEI